MIAELLREDIEAMDVNGNVSEAINLLNAQDVYELPITDGSRYVYLLRELDIMSSDAEKMSEVSADREGHYIFEDEHILQALIKVNAHDLSIIPVLNRELEYKGALRRSEILDYICNSHSLSGEGSIIILEQYYRDYSLTTLANIIEQEGGKVMGIFTSAIENDMEKLWVSLKLNTHDTAAIISSLERHEYEIVAQMNGGENESVMKERYESLMNFLNV